MQLSEIFPMKSRQKSRASAADSEASCVNGGKTSLWFRWATTNIRYVVWMVIVSLNFPNYTLLDRKICPARHIQPAPLQQATVSRMSPSLPYWPRTWYISFSEVTTWLGSIKPWTFGCFIYYSPPIQRTILCSYTNRIKTRNLLFARHQWELLFSCTRIQCNQFIPKNQCAAVNVHHLKVWRDLLGGLYLSSFKH